MNYFKLLNLPESYSLDKNVLAQRYELLQRMTHPDKFASASEQEKSVYLQKNADVNEAERVLSSDVMRGEHLLDVRGAELASDQDTISDSDFLTQQMDLRERLASASNEAEIEALNRDIGELRADYVDRIIMRMNANNSDGNRKAAIELNKLKFVIKLSEEVKQRKRSLLNADK